MGKCRIGDEMRGTAQAPVHVFAKIRELEHALKRVGMEHLQEKTANAADHHPDNIGMDHANGAVEFEQRLIGRRARGGRGISLVERSTDIADYSLP